MRTSSGPLTTTYRAVHICSAGRGGMAQNGRTFDDKMDRCRKKQGWTTACSGMPERDGKDQGEDSPKQEGSCPFGLQMS